jgi:hypothetical protein
MAGIIETIFSGPAFDKYNQIRGDSYVNSPTKFDYDLRSNEAAGQFIQDKTKELLGDNLGSKILGQAATYASVPLALYSSPFHEGLQVVKENRMKPESGIRGFYDAFMKERPFTTALNRAGGVLQSTPLGQNIYNFAGKLADLNLSKTLSDLVFTPAGAAEVTPGNVQNQGLDSFNNLVSDTVMAEPNQFQDYPGDKNLGGVQNFDLEGVRDIISQMEEEKGNYIERPEDGFNMDGILQNLGGYAKNTAGRYIGSQALGGAGAMLFGPIGGLVGGIIGALKGGDLFNQNTYSQQMYNNLTPGGKAYASSLYGPGGVLQGYNQFSGFGRGTLGTIANNLAKNPNMSPARRNAYRTAADKYISGIDPTQQGYNAVTKKGGYGYDDAYINYAPPSGGGKDSGSGDGRSGGSGSDLRKWF